MQATCSLINLPLRLLSFASWSHYLCLHSTGFIFFSFFSLVAIITFLQFEDHFLRLMFQTGRPAWRESCSLPDPLSTLNTTLSYPPKISDLPQYSPRNFQKGLPQLLELLIINELLFNSPTWKKNLLISSILANTLHHLMFSQVLVHWICDAFQPSYPPSPSSPSAFNLSNH